MRADLHIHSVYSDGSHTPAELAFLAKRKGIELIALTDHDNFGGEAEKRAAFAAQGIDYLTGVELSAYENGKKIHMTGYGYDVTSPLLAKYQAERVKQSYDRLYDVLGKLKRYKGIFLPEEKVREQLFDGGMPVHTMHVARALAKEGYYATIKEIFADCFMPGQPTYSYVGRLTPAEAVEILHSMGGVACIAHPGRIDLPFDEREKLIFRLKEEGADGIECFYPTHTVEETAYFCGLADRLGLLKTGGSDYHCEWGKRLPGAPLFEPDEGFLRAAHVRGERLFAEEKR